MQLRDALGMIVGDIDASKLTFKQDSKGRDMATTRTVNLLIPAGAVPGMPGKVARIQATVCVNYLGIGDAAEFKAKTEKQAVNVLDALDPETRAALLAKYAQ